MFNLRLLDTIGQKSISLQSSGEVETGSAGEQPVRNSLIDWNGRGGFKQPPISHDYSKKLCLGKPNRKHDGANSLLYV
jgi:hypothetical protein